MTSFAPELLDCLTALVEEGSFERAARRLSITQSAVSQRLKTLEGLAGTVLIARDRPLRATPAGRLLFKHALQLRLLRTDLEHELQHLSPSASTCPSPLICKFRVPGGTTIGPPAPCTVKPCGVIRTPSPLSTKAPLRVRY